MPVSLSEKGVAFVHVGLNNRGVASVRGRSVKEVWLVYLSVLMKEAWCVY